MSFPFDIRLNCYFWRKSCYGNLYGVTSWKQSVTDIKSAIWHTFALSIALYDTCRCDSMHVLLLNSCVLLRVLWFYLFFFFWFNCNISCCFYAHVATLFLHGETMKEWMNEWMNASFSYFCTVYKISMLYIKTFDKLLFSDLVLPLSCWITITFNWFYWVIPEECVKCLS